MVFKPSNPKTTVYEKADRHPLALWNLHYRHCDQEWSEVWPTNNVTDYCPLCGEMTTPLRVEEDLDKMHFCVHVNQHDFRVLNFSGGQSEYAQVIHLINTHYQDIVNLPTGTSRYYPLNSARIVEIGLRMPPEKDKSAWRNHSSWLHGPGPEVSFDIVTTGGDHHFKMTGMKRPDPIEEEQMRKQLLDVVQAANEVTLYPGLPASSVINGWMTLHGRLYHYEEKEIPVFPAANMHTAIIDRFYNIAENWSKPTHSYLHHAYTPAQMCHGVAHDILKAIGGHDPFLPALNLTVSPYTPDGKETYYWGGTTDSDLQQRWPYGEQVHFPEPPHKEYQEKYENFRARFSACAKDLFD